MINHGVDPGYAGLDRPSFADVARSLGGGGVTVRTLAELERAAGEIPLELTAPMLLEIQVDPRITPAAS